MTTNTVPFKPVTSIGSPYCRYCCLETPEPLLANCCQCVGNSRLHYSCLRHLVIDTSDDLCGHCRHQFVDRRIQRRPMDRNSTTLTMASAAAATISMATTKRSTSTVVAAAILIAIVVGVAILLASCCYLRPKCLSSSKSALSALKWTTNQSIASAATAIISDGQQQLLKCSQHVQCVDCLAVLDAYEVYYLPKRIIDRHCCRKCRPIDPPKPSPPSPPSSPPSSSSRWWWTRTSSYRTMLWQNKSFNNDNRLTLAIVGAIVVIVVYLLVKCYRYRYINSRYRYTTTAGIIIVDGVDSVDGGNTDGVVVVDDNTTNNNDYNNNSGVGIGSGGNDSRVVTFDKCTDGTGRRLTPLTIVINCSDGQSSSLIELPVQTTPGTRSRSSPYELRSRSRQ